MKRSLWKRLVLGGVGTMVCAALLAGCGGSEKAAEIKNDVLKFGVTNFADTLEPTENYFAWVVVRYGLGENLTKFDEKMNVVPQLAKAWTVSDDHMTWTLELRDDVKFSNGRQMTAQAVKESIERVFAKSKRATTFFEYTALEANGQTLKITTTKPQPGMPGFLADPLFTIVDVQSEKEGRNFAKEGPIATGPYAVQSFTKDRSVMVANEHYWGPKPPFKTVEIPSIDDPNTRALALRSGDVNMAVNIAASDLEMFRNDKGFHVDEIASLRTVLARLNQKGILADPKVRAAIISATDRKTYAEVLLKGTFIPGKAPVPPSLDFGFDQLNDPNAYNPERAKTLLAEAGWKDTDGDKILDKDGQKLSLRIVTYNSRAELPTYAEAIQADLAKLGVEAKIELVDYNLLDGMGIKGDYDLMISNNTTAATGDPALYLAWYWKTNVDGSNEQNGSGYSNPVYDAKLDELSAEFDPEKRRALIIELQQILLNDGAGLFLGYPMTNFVSSTGLQNVIMFPSDYYWLTADIKPAK